MKNCSRKRALLLASASAIGFMSGANAAVIDYPNGSTNPVPIILTDNTTQLQVLTGVATQSGIISGVGFGVAKIGAGQLNLTAPNLYTGTTTISAGTLQIGAGGLTGSIIGNVVDNSALIFNRSDATTYGGVISGTGTVSQSGAGVLTLTGTETYTGQTTINTGTLALSGSGSIGASSSVLDNGTFDISGTTTGTSITALSGGGSVNLGSKALTVTAGTGSAFSGVIAGTGSVTLAGGTQVLTGANTYTGGTTVNSGATLSVGNGSTTGSISGNITDNGTFIFNRSDAITYAGVLSGTGAVNQNGAGILTLTGANTFTGPTNINSGTIALSGAGTLASSSAVLANGTLDISATSGATIKGLAGSGSVSLGSKTLTLAGGSSFAGTIKDGGIAGGTGGGLTIASGVQSLTGANSYTGATTINSGATLQLGTGGGAMGSVAGAIVDNGSLIFSGNNTAVVANLISGTGSVTQSGSGTAVLTGANTYTGGTTVAAGTLQIGNGGTSGSVAGNVIDNATLVFNRSDAVTYAGVVSGAGNLVQAGTGPLTLNGNSSTFTGRTTVASGLLNVGDATHAGAALGGLVTVNSGGSLGGFGTLTGSVTNAGKTAPGGAIGTLSVNGNYAFASGATLQQEVAANGTGDLLKVGGAVSIAGNTSLQVLPTDPAASYARVTNYTVVTGTGGVSGAFTNVTSAAATLTPIVNYSASAVNLTLVRNDINLATLANTPNQAGVGAAISSAPSSAIFAAVAPMANAQLPATFDSLSGEIHASLTDALLYDGGWLSDAIQSRGEAGEGVHLWGSEEYRSNNFNGTTNTAAEKGSLLGTAVGADIGVMEGVRLGAVVGLSHGIVRLDARTSEARLNSLSAGGYLRANLGGFGVDAAVTRGWNNIGTFRQAFFAGTSQAETADYNATTTNAFVQASYRFDLGGGSLSPFVNLNSVRVEKEAFTEAGGIAALSGGKTDNDVMFTNVGGRFDTSYDIMGGKLSPWVSLGWEHANDTVSAGQGLAFSSGSAFTVSGAPISKDAFAVQAGLGLALDGINLNVLYAGRNGSSSTENTFRFNLQTSF